MTPSLRHRLLTYQVILLIAAIGILGTTSYLLLAGQLRQVQVAPLPRVAAVQANHLGSILRSRELLLQRLATSTPVERFLLNRDPKAVEPILAGYLGDFAGVALLDEDNAVTVAAGRAGAAPVALPHDLFQESLWHPNRPLAFFTADSVLLVYYLEPFGEFGTVVAGRLPVEAVAREFGETDTGSMLALCDRNGRILFTLPQAAGDAGRGIQPFWLHTGADTPPVREAPFLGRQCYLAAAPVPDHDWYLVSALPKETFLAAPRRLQFILGGLAVAAVISGVILAASLANAITRPLRDLTVAANQLAAQDWPSPLPVTSDDEIGRLAQAFNAMSSALARAMEERDQEIEERRRVETELRRSQGQLAATFLCLDHGLLTLDADGRVLFYNDRAHHFLDHRHPAGRPLDEVLRLEDETTGRPVTDLLDACHRHDPFRLEARLAGGEALPLALTSSHIVSKGGDFLGFVVLLQDLTPFRRAQEELRRAKEAAEDHNRLKDQFLANISHEIRTPLNGILGMGEMLLEQDLEPEAHRYAATIFSSSQRLLALINEILDFAKLESDTVTLETVAFSLADTVEADLELRRLEAERKGLTFTVVKDPGLPHRLKGDPLRLRQVVDNLVANAVKFTETGEVRVELACTAGDTGGLPPQGPRNRNIRLTVRVADTGIGIPEPERERIFQPFVQADGSTTRRYGGTGLGLAIVRQLVDLMGGEIAIVDHHGPGTIFQVHIPLEIADPPPPAPAPSPVATTDLTGTRILLAEDDPINQAVVRAMLAKAGAEVTVAGDGDAAVAACQHDVFDLVLMDVQMPGRDGLAAAGAIRAWEEEHDRPRLPIVAMTAHARPEDRDQALAAGMDDHIAKPVNRGQLLALVARHCRRLQPQPQPTEKA